MKLRHLLDALVLALAMLALAPGSALATPRQEKQLVAAAETQLDVLLNPSAEKSAQIKALYALDRIHTRMKALADADPHFKQRPDTEPFRNMYEGMDDFIKAESKKLGVNLSEPPPAPSTANAASAPAAATAAETGEACTASPMPHYYDRSDYAPLGQAVRDAYAELGKQLDQPPADTFQGRAAQTAKRDELLQKYILAQIAYVWEVASPPDTTQWVDLLQDADRYSKALQDKRGADAEELKQIARLAALRAKWDSVKDQFAHGGTTIPALMPLDAAARQTIKRIMALRKRSNASYQAFLAGVEPMEKKAAALFKAQMQKGLQEINYHLRAEGDKGQPFTLFRPNTGHERELLNRIIGAWIIHKLGVFGAREGVHWVDWNDFKNFDFQTKGLSPKSPCLPKADERQSAAPPKKPAPKKKKKCHGGGLVGAVNCVTTKMGD